MGATDSSDADAFMTSLLGGLDASVFSSPTLSPVSSQRPKRGEARAVSGSQKRRLSNGGSFTTRPWRPEVRAANANAKCEEGDVRSTPPLKNQALHKVELQEIEDLFQDEGSALLLDMDSFTPSPQKVKESPKKKEETREPLATIVNNSERSTVERNTNANHPSRYVRCRVDRVTHETYIPERYLQASRDRHIIRGVKVETRDAAMQRKQIKLHLTQVFRKVSQEESDDPEGFERLAILRDEWVYTHVQPGDFVHLIGTWASIDVRPAQRHIAVGLEWNETYTQPVVKRQKMTTIPCMTLSADINADHEADNYLILRPDFLLSATAISSAVMTCPRKPILQAKVKASGPGPDEKPTEALIMGRMLHEVLQSCLTGIPKVVEIDSSVYAEHIFSAPSTFPTDWAGPDGTNFSEAYIKGQIIVQVLTSLEDLLHCNLDTRTASERLWKATLPFGPFASVYLNCPHGTQSAFAGPNVTAEAIDTRSLSNPLVRVVRVHDVEEDIWSPMFGLKGFVDVSVEVEIVERKETNEPINAFTAMMPLELKTGRSINLAEHRAQTMLYTLMMSDRYDRSVLHGLLYYSKSGEMHMVRTARHEVRGLIVARNELASYMGSSKKRGRDRTITQDSEASSPPTISRTLPPTIDVERTCSKCFVVDTCMLYRKAIDAIPDDQDSPITDLSISRTSHLTPQHLAFFRHWDRLLTLEEADVVHHRREMWTMTAEARERAGRCFANMTLSLQPAPATQYLEGIRVTSMNESHVYRFERRTVKVTPTQEAEGEAQSLLGGNFAVGDAICVSIEPALLSIAQGYLLELKSDHIIVGVDKRLEAIMQRSGQSEKPLFRIDKEEQVSGMARTRYNLAKLFFAPPAGDARRRELIVELRAPIFAEALSTTTAVHGKAFSDLNADQQHAIQTVLRAQDYALIVGMPGTGKTTTIARLITLLARQGKSVLLASYTHSAVDTICRKLVQSGGEDVRLLRLGTADRVHKDVQPYMLRQSETVEQLQTRILGPNVVATTCLSVGHVLFGVRNAFDYCIVDEASQITLPTCLGPLRYAHKFVLVGDPQQLPPLVRDPRARQGGLEVSLFERLQRAHPDSIAYMCAQYRMNKDIMTLSNTLIYNDQLRCGSEAHAHASVDLPYRDAALKRMYARQQHCAASAMDDDECAWLTRALDARALFVNTDGLQAWEQRLVGELVENGAEARMTVDLCLALIMAGVPSEEIAIVTPYRQQIRRLTHLLANTNISATSSASDATPPSSPSLPDCSNVEVWTADKSQGRDKDVIIVNFVRSFAPNETVKEEQLQQQGVDDEGIFISVEDNGNEIGNDNDGARQYNAAHVGQLLHDVRRINVALTRARKKLIILGSRQTLTHVPLLSHLWNLMDAKGWTISPQRPSSLSIR